MTAIKVSLDLYTNITITAESGIPVSFYNFFDGITCLYEDEAFCDYNARVPINISAYANEKLIFYCYNPEPTKREISKIQSNLQSIIEEYRAKLYHASAKAAEAEITRTVYATVSDQGPNPGPADCRLKEGPQNYLFQIEIVNKGISLDQKITALLRDLEQTRFRPRINAIYEKIIPYPLYTKEKGYSRMIKY